jgi:hypothetical protein
MGFRAQLELLYDWRFTGNQFVLATSPLRPTTSDFIFQLNTCGYSPYVTSSLTRGWTFRLQFLLVLASAVILRFKSGGTHDHTLLPLYSQNLEGQVPMFICPKEQGGQVIAPGTGFPFRRLLRFSATRIFPVKYHREKFSPALSESPDCIRRSEQQKNLKRAFHFISRCGLLLIARFVFWICRVQILIRRTVTPLIRGTSTTYNILSDLLFISSPINGLHII